MTTRTKARTNRFVGLAVSTALASTLLTGCGGMPGVKSAQSPATENAAVAKANSAVMHAEAAVLASPRSAEARGVLAQAYLDAGRFQSAATTFGEAVSLGDTSPQTVINLVLAQIGAGDNDGAAATLNAHVDRLSPADFGFAIALAGRAEHGVHILTNQLRMGNNTPKVRQNLAYAFALAGNWRSARVMAAEDVPADQLGDRMALWATMVHPEQGQLRIANLLEVTPVADPGQPTMLALANFQDGPQLASAVVPAETSFTPASELPAVDNSELASLDVGEAALAEAIPVSESPSFATAAVTPAAPAQAASFSEAFAPAKPAAARSPAPAQARLATGDYSVQLGSFSSMSAAHDGWKEFQRRYPELAGAEKVVTKARVNGKIYYRVAAKGYARGSARQLCSSVKGRGGGCIAHATSRPLPGAILGNVRMASR